MYLEYRGLKILRSKSSRVTEKTSRATHLFEVKHRLSKARGDEVLHDPLSLTGCHRLVAR